MSGSSSSPSPSPSDPDREAHEDLPPGCTLSYSAGSTRIDPFAYRVLDPTEDRLADLLTAFPALAAALGDTPPVALLAYPARVFASLPRAITVDTYLSGRTFARGLQLAARLDRAAILVSQPLIAWRLLADYAERWSEWPRHLIVILGGYACPRSLEEAIVSIVPSGRDRVSFLFGYGAAEVGAGCLLGSERTPEGNVLYHPADPRVRPEIRGGELCLIATRGREDEEPVVARTGDSAESTLGGWLRSSSSVTIRTSGQTDPIASEIRW